MQTLDQKIAATEAKLARLRQKSRALENGQKIILGGMLINAAKKDPQIRRWLLKEAQISVSRQVDKNRLAPLLAELEELAEIEQEKADIETIMDESLNDIEGWKG